MVEESMPEHPLEVTQVGVQDSEADEEDAVTE